MTISKLGKDDDSRKKRLVVVESCDPSNLHNGNKNGIKKPAPSKYFTRAHVHNTTRLSPVPVMTHPLALDANEGKPLSQLPAWDLPPMIDIVFSPDSGSSGVSPDDCIEDPDEVSQNSRRQTTQQTHSNYHSK